MKKSKSKRGGSKAKSKVVHNNHVSAKYSNIIKRAKAVMSEAGKSSKIKRLKIKAKPYKKTSLRPKNIKIKNPVKKPKVNPIKKHKVIKKTSITSHKNRNKPIKSFKKQSRDKIMPLKHPKKVKLEAVKHKKHPKKVKLGAVKHKSAKAEHVSTKPKTYPLNKAADKTKKSKYGLIKLFASLTILLSVASVILQKEGIILFNQMIISLSATFLTFVVLSLIVILIQKKKKSTKKNVSNKNANQRKHAPVAKNVMPQDKKLDKEEQIIKRKRFGPLRKFIISLAILSMVNFIILFRQEIVTRDQMVIGIVATVIIFVLFMVFTGRKKNKHYDKAKDVKDISKKEDSIQFKSSTFKTDLDRLYILVHKNHSVSISEISKTFNISKVIAEEWARILHDHELLELEYPAIGEPVLKWKQKQNNTKSPQKE